MRPFLTCLLTALAAPALAGSPVVVDAGASRQGDTWRFDVTVAHDDAGWDHYADAWEILAPDGTRLGIRELLHPHDTEQPFTRALTGVAIPDGTDRIGIRARDSVHGWGETLTIELPRQR